MILFTTTLVNNTSFHSKHLFFELLKINVTMKNLHGILIFLPVSIIVIREAIIEILDLMLLIFLLDLDINSLF